jgi:hypothetical protein
MSLQMGILLLLLSGLTLATLSCINQITKFNFVLFPFVRIRGLNKSLYLQNMCCAIHLLLDVD